MNRIAGPVAIGLLVSAAGAAAPQAATGAAAACDRQCLSGYVTGYLAALTAHDPKRLPLAPNVRFTENGVAIPLGEALWTTITRLGDYRSDYVDTEAQQVASIVAFVENDKPGLMSVRLKIVGGKIAEIETVLNRSNAGALEMKPADPIWQAVEPAAKRLTRAQLAKEAEGYLKAVATGDSRYVHFNPDSCIRFENSMVMALAPKDEAPGPTPRDNGGDGWINIIAKTLRIGCAAQIDTKVYSFITSYDNARFPVIDVERQVVFGQWNFRRGGKIQGIDFEGKHYQYGVGQQFPNENLLGEAFKFRDGGITRVQGVFLNSNVYKAGTGWDAKPAR